MCGIAGQVVVNGEADFHRVKSMTEYLRHRGPDDEGMYVNESRTVIFGHRRLSIIDLSTAARQPMTTTDGRFTIVFNGEIYNYQKLRKKLLDKGIKFSSHSDTEVLLYLWQQKGKECSQGSPTPKAYGSEASPTPKAFGSQGSPTPKAYGLLDLRGMFAFAIWDEQEKVLTLARDPLGIKPLYYRLDNKGVVFASEIRSLRAGGWTGQLNPEGIGAFLQWGHIPAPLTIYSDIKTLPAGSFLQFNQKERQHEIVYYWNHCQAVLDAKNDDNRPVNQKDAVSWVRENLLQSVKEHLVSDVPVGTFLSGGIDSTAVVSLMRQAGQERIATFSITFDDDELDESRYSHLAARHYQTEHHSWKVCKSDFEELKNDYLESIEQPTVDGVNTWFVSRFAHEHGYKVVTSGVGGDEFFYGYNGTFHQLPKLLELLKRTPSGIRRFGAGFLQMSQKLNLFARLTDAKGFRFGSLTNAKGLWLGGKWNKLTTLLKSAPTLEHGYSLYRGLFTSEQIKTLFKDKDFGREAAEITITDFLPELSEELSVLQQISILEASFYLRSQLLSDSDVFSMAHSLELRTPFVDRVLTEALAKVDDRFFFDQRKTPKALLVNAVGDLPNQLVYRKKQTFTFPLGKWLKQMPWHPSSVGGLSPTSGVLKEGVIKDIDNEFRSGRTHWSRRWALELLDYILS